MVRDFQQRHGALELDTELFGKLTFKRRVRRFIRVALATREFPAPRVRFAGGTLGDQHPAFAVDQGARDHLNGRGVLEAAARGHGPSRRSAADRGSV